MWKGITISQLKKPALTVRSILDTADFNVIELAFLSDFYFDARYPGPDYVKVNKDTYIQCEEIMYSCKSKVDQLLQELNRKSIKED